jgi:hypothetical protein
MANTASATAGGGGTGGSSALIASDRVEGTPVKRSNGDTVGRIEHLMIEKRSGRVAYAVMSFGGVLGMGADHHTLPWNVLKYSTELDAYVLDATDEQLGGAPRRGGQAQPGGSQDPSLDREWEEHVHKYFNSAPYWNEDAPRATHETKAP